MKSIKKRIASLLTVFTMTIAGTLAPGMIQSYAVGESSLRSVELSVSYGQKEARSMLSMINELRTGGNAWVYDQSGNRVTLSGLSELEYDYGLESAAMQRAAEIALRFSHERPDGTMCNSVITERALNTGYVYAENLEAGSSTARAAFVDLCEEKMDYSGQGHRRNMLSDQVRTIGIGHAICNGVDYWVHEFGGSASGSTATEAAEGKASVSVRVDTSLVTGAGIFDTGSEKQKTDIVCGKSLQLMNYRVGIRMQETYPSGYYVPTEEYISWSMESGASVATLSVSSIPGDRNAAVIGAGEGSFAVKGSFFDGTASGTISGTCKHNWDTGNRTTNPTCVLPGVIEYHCPCGQTKTESIPATGHSEVTLPYQEPTHIHEGLTEGKRCSVCNEILVPQEPIPKLKEHVWDNGVVVVEPTRTTEGEMLYTCICGATKKESIPKLSDDSDNKVKLKKLTITSIRNLRSKKVVLILTKDAKSDGTQIQFSLKKTFATTNNRYTNAKKYTVKKLKKKTYYFRVRAYKKNGAKRIYGKWSAVKKIKVRM